MVMPLWDHSPFKWPTPPYVMWLLVILNLIVFFVQVGGGPQQMHEVDHIAGVNPLALTGHPVGGLWPPLTLITYQFLHINFGHVFGNMIFLLYSATTSRKCWDIGGSLRSISCAVSAPLSSS